MLCTLTLLGALLALGPAQNQPPDLARLKASAEAGDAEAWYLLAGRTVVDAEKIAFLEKAVELGYDKAFERLIDYLLFRAASAADVKAAKKYGDLARERGASLGYDTPKMLTTIDRCYEAGEPVIPKAHQPTAAERKTYETEIECTPPYLVGKSSPADYRRYRLCLLSQSLDRNRWLAEVYANGWSVRRDPKLAMALVCHGSDVP